MALPKLNDTVKYSAKIPSTGQEIRFRPFLIKEEKVLLLAMESQDGKMIMQSILDTLNACIEDNINASRLPLFDIEYLFLQIRSKSVGETSDVKIKCKKCEEYNEINVNLEDIKVSVPKKIRTIVLDDKYSIQMKYPNITDIMNAGILSKDITVTDLTFKSISMCIDSLLTDEEKISFADESQEEIDNFINSLNSKQFDDIKKFVDTIPQLKHKIEFNCTSCEEPNTVNLQGTDDFF